MNKGLQIALGKQIGHKATVGGMIP